jgi:hypothetical protein
MEFSGRIRRERQRSPLSAENHHEGDPLFEQDWAVFVVRRDPETGRFHTETISDEPLTDLDTVSINSTN